MTDPGVIVVGSLTADLTSWSERLPRRGETVLGTSFTLVPGGKGANQALTAARMGTPTWMVGCVGDDLFRPVVLDGLTAAGVSSEYVETRTGVATGIAHIRVDATGENDIVMVPLANAELSTDHVDHAIAALRSQATVMLIQLEIPVNIAAHAIRAGAAAGMRVVLDPAPAAPLPDDVWAAVEVVTPNEIEASLLTGINVIDRDDAEAAARWFCNRGVRLAVITLGAQGAVTVNAEGQARHYPAHPVTPVDTTAAGDAFTGTLGATLADNGDLGTALRHALAAGALAVTRAGASSSLPNRRAVEALLAATAADVAASAGTEARA